MSNADAHNITEDKNEDTVHCSLATGHWDDVMHTSYEDLENEAALSPVNFNAGK